LRFVFSQIAFGNEMILDFNVLGTTVVATIRTPVMNAKESKGPENPRAFVQSRSQQTFELPESVTPVEGF
jgi:hypothetical protein